MPGIITNWLPPLNPKTFARNATIIQIDIDASELGKNVDVDLAIVGDAAYVLNAMLPMIEDKKHPDWIKTVSYTHLDVYKRQVRRPDG